MAMVNSLHIRADIELNFATCNSDSRLLLGSKLTALFPTLILIEDCIKALCRCDITFQLLSLIFRETHPRSLAGVSFVRKFQFGLVWVIGFGDFNVILQFEGYSVVLAVFLYASFLIFTWG